MKKLFIMFMLFVNIIIYANSINNEISNLEVPNKNYKITGNCIEKLKNYTQVKNIILSNTKHNLLNNPYVKDEILLFINNVTKY